MKLATAEQVLARMNLYGLSGDSGQTAVNSALEGATSAIETVLRTPLGQAERYDYYDYSRSRYDLFKPFVLWSTQRFITGDVEVKISENGDAITDFEAATTLESTYYQLNPYSGKIDFLMDVIPGYSVIAIRYTAGFTEGDSAIPAWLTEAAVVAAIYLQHIQSVSHGKKDQASAVKPLRRSLYAALNPYIQTQFEGFQPCRTSKVEA